MADLGRVLVALQPQPQVPCCYARIYDTFRRPFRDVVVEGVTRGDFSPRDSVEDVVDRLTAQIEGLRVHALLEPAARLARATCSSSSIAQVEQDLRFLFPVGVVASDETASDGRLSVNVSPSSLALATGWGSRTQPSSPEAALRSPCLRSRARPVPTTAEEINDKRRRSRRPYRRCRRPNRGREGRRGHRRPVGADRHRRQQCWDDPLGDRPARNG